jgi:regulator of sigma E protease
LAQRAAIVFAGPAANFLFAIAVLALLFNMSGIREARDFAASGIGTVVEGSPAQAAGLMEGDRILTIEGRSISDWSSLVLEVQNSEGRELLFEIDRKGLLQEIRLAPAYHEDAQTYRIGIQAPFHIISLGPVASLVMAVERTWDFSVMTLSAIGEILIGQRSLDDMGGPVKIVDMSNEVAQRGALDLVIFTAILSINLGLLNLLPIPMLDGGHLLFYAIEAIRGKPLDEKSQDMLLKVGMSALLSFMVVVTLNDLRVFDLLK